MTSTLSPQRIASLCRNRAQISLLATEETGSTNADLLAAVPTLSGPTLLAAERQTAGRGRAGRSWHSEAGASLTFSLAWQFSLPVHALLGLPLAVGVAIAQTLAALDVPARLKWPNDVLLDDRKLAGVLIETAQPANGTGTWAVIGIGLNMTVPASVAAQLDRPAAGLATLPASRKPLEREALLAALVDALSEAMAEFESEGLAAFAERWNRLHAYAGRAVAIVEDGRVLHQGRAKGIDRFGRFLLESETGPVAIMSGDVSLRAVEG